MDADSIRPYKKGLTPPIDYTGTRAWLDGELAKLQRTLKTVEDALRAVETRVVSVERLPALTFATLPAGAAGLRAYITDCNTTTWGATAAGGGSNKVQVWHNGTNWTVVGR